jgi:hypothetical protein
VPEATEIEKAAIFEFRAVNLERPTFCIGNGNITFNLNRILKVTGYARIGAAGADAQGDLLCVCLALDFITFILD